MGVLTIRRLDEDVISRLKEKASLNGRSMEEEARIAICQSVATGALVGEAAVGFFRSLRRELFGDRILPDSTLLIREIREGDPTGWDEA
ncbi:MAG TPA: hypothetical protein VFC47_16070 [Caulobacteraceae bacterium]|nr:hypothetical protein [Caulobacteraceae bacterium]